MIRFARDVMLWCVIVLIVVCVSAACAEAPAQDAAATNEVKAAVTAVTTVAEAAEEQKTWDENDPERVLVSVDGVDYTHT